jgi:hypothetical protein
MGGKISCELDERRIGEVKEVKERTTRMIGEIAVEGGVDLTQRTQS